jgi:alpha-D-ribose 1-methylphosphonate 5-phosphate C-P lyase
MIVDDTGKRMFVCSDSDYCHERREQQATQLAAQLPANGTGEPA